MAINYDKRNYRKHNDKNKKLIKKSLEECGAGRSIVIDKEDNIIAGNGIYEQAQKLGLKTKVIETDGSELVVVKRTDLATDDEKRKQLAVMDNSTSDTSQFDTDLLKNDFSVDTLEGWGITLKEKIEEDAEVEFTEELLEEHNYIVLYFDNSVDWLQAKTLFGIKKVKDSNTSEKLMNKGVGKVLKGAEALKILLGNNF